MYFPNFKVRKGLEGPAKDGETVTLEQIETDDENDEVGVIVMTCPTFLSCLRWSTKLGN